MTGRLGELRARLTRLHRTLLDDQRLAHEAAHGPVSSPPELLRLLLHHEDFSWLRTLSAMIAAIDATLDETEDADGDADPFVRQARTLLRSGGHSPFETKYRDALQRSPDVVIAHAAVVTLL